MKFKDFLDTFVKYNKRIYKKLIIIGILLFYFIFLFYFNYYRVILGYDLAPSWGFGILFAIITTLAFILAMDIFRVLIILKSGRHY